MGERARIERQCGSVRACVNQRLLQSVERGGALAGTPHQQGVNRLQRVQVQRVSQNQGVSFLSLIKIKIFYVLLSKQ